MDPQPTVRILASRAAAPVIMRELSRRRFLAASAVLGGAAFLAACAPGGKPAPVSTGGALEKELSIYSWGDYDAPEVLADFTKTLGPKITMDAFGSNEELISKLVSAKGTAGYDIVVPTGVYIPQMVENKLLTKLNKKLIPNIKNLDPTYLGRSFDPGNDYSICKAWGTTGFVYDKTVISRELTTWADFLDCAQKEASGKTSVLDDPAELSGMYFWSNGIDWNTTDNGLIDGAEAFIVDKLAPHISVFDSYPGGSAIPQSTSALFQVWNGDARQGILASKEPKKWQWVLPGPTTELWMDNWAIAAGAPHPEAAHAFINYVLTPENAMRELEYIGYHTGEKDIEQKAKAAKVPLLDLVFFDQKQLATMKDGAVTIATERIVDIWNKAKAAAGA